MREKERDSYIRGESICTGEWVRGRTSGGHGGMREWRRELENMVKKMEKGGGRRGEMGKMKVEYNKV